MICTISKSGQLLVTFSVGIFMNIKKGTVSFCSFRSGISFCYLKLNGLGKTQAKTLNMTFMFVAQFMMVLLPYKSIPSTCMCSMCPSPVELS